MAASSVVNRTLAWTSRQLSRRVPRAQSNPYLEGRFAPVTEERTETTLRVTGSIPPELNGLYARIGPNPFEVHNPAAYHWFVGDGMVHGLRLRDGEALWYRNRWIGSDSAQQRLGRPILPGDRRAPIDVVNTNVIGHGGRLWALVESGPLPVELDGELDSLRHGLFDSRISAAYSAHPHRDPISGELHAICYDSLKPTRVQHVVVDAQCRVTRVENIPVKHGPMIHDCALTASRVVVLDLPITFSFAEMLRGYPFPYRWNPRHPARVGLLPRSGSASDIRWFEVEPCFVFHSCNAYDREDGAVVLDVVVHGPLFDRSHQGPEVGPIRFERWTLAPTSTQVQRQPLSDRRQEFPRMDERRSGAEYRYAYTAGFSLDATAQPLLRHDLATGRCAVHDYGPHHVTGEAVFVPRPGTTDEDEGWLISYVYDLRENRSDLVILDAKDFEGAPQAIVHLPLRVPMGFHGNWIAD